MFGQQHRIQRLPVGSDPPGHHADRFDRGGLQAVQIVQQSVLVQRQVFDDLLGGVDLVTHADEPDHVTGDASGQGDQLVDRPVGQRRVPRLLQQPRVGLGGQEPRHLVILARRSNVRPTGLGVPVDGKPERPATCR